MRRCTYCGKGYEAQITVCPLDGQAVQEAVASHAVPKSFFRWKVVSVSLVVLAVLYWAVALLNLFLVRTLEQQSDTRNVRFLLWGAFWNVVVGSLCFIARRLIKPSNLLSCGVGAFALGTALLIVMRTWLGGLFTGRNPFPVLEALLVWPWLIYAIMYAASLIQKQSGAEPVAPPNGGPVTPATNSGVSERPPSVS